MLIYNIFCACMTQHSRQVVPTARAIEKLLSAEPNAPIVVFVWFRDSARALVEALADHRIRHGDKADSSSGIGIDAGGERGNDAFESFSRIRCDVISGDIVHQSVGTQLHLLN